ncbi:hypothetical protein N5U20_00680 [Aliarcobacter butzleri]|uniref:hypothetical protein n=1 Tax=Aliarcobacter butzleri TaxID=28197 RepID=UPI00125F0B64|nr:hypothetical protein [Aliarcobacter butzleri]MCT7611714.1 hypothetical protein [Aliarcobacter butzleri]MCT7640323.1 hypothetical protein [Aliarcobacter butzleri]
MKAYKFLLKSKKINNVNDLLANVDAIIDILKEDIFKISKSKKLHFYDFDFTYSAAVSILKTQIQKKHLSGVKRFFKFDNIEDNLKWLVSRIINNMRNFTTNPKYKLFLNLEKIDIYRENNQGNNYFENEVLLLELERLDRKIIKIGLKKVWDEAKYDEDFDYIDFIDLCEKYGFDADEVVGSHTSTQIQFKKQLIDNYKYQLELII